MTCGVGFGFGLAIGVIIIYSPNHTQPYLQPSRSPHLVYIRLTSRKLSTPTVYLWARAGSRRARGRARSRAGPDCGGKGSSFHK